MQYDVMARMGVAGFVGTVDLSSDKFSLQIRGPQQRDKLDK
jgi:hypothetical protein